MCRGPSGNRSASGLAVLRTARPRPTGLAGEGCGTGLCVSGPWHHRRRPGMGGLKSGAILLLLAVPFALYAAWQVRGVSRADLIVSDPPSDKGVPAKEQLAAARAKAEKWSADVRKAAAVTYQFRAPGPDDAAADDECNALARSAAARSAELTDLEQFLAGVEK